MPPFSELKNLKTQRTQERICSYLGIKNSGFTQKILCVLCGCSPRSRRFRVLISGVEEP